MYKRRNGIWLDQTIDVKMKGTRGTFVKIVITGLPLNMSLNLSSLPQASFVMSV